MAVLLRILRLALVYFSLVFAVAFVLGILRVLLLVPRVGAPIAEILELPLIVLWSWIVARWGVRRFGADLGSAGLALAGGLALAAVLALEFALVIGLGGGTPADWYAGRDPLAFGFYLLALGLFAVFPVLARRRGERPVA
jgi:hypothetical protein